MKIFVCDDDKYFLNFLTEEIKNYVLFQKNEMTLELYTTSPDEMISYLTTTSVFSDALFFLDIDLKHEINGVSLANSIKEILPNAKIVFITTHDELSYLVFKYKIEAMDYIIKDDIKTVSSRVKECIRLADERFNQGSIQKEDAITLKSEGQYIKANISEIIFFESSSQPHRITLHLFNRHLDFYGNIKDIPALNENFIRCHQSYVVNLLNIKSVDFSKKEVLFVNGETCFTSIRYQKNLKEKFLNKELPVKKN